MSSPFESRLRDENEAYEVQLKTASGQSVCIGKLSVCKTPTGFSLETTKWPEGFNIQEAEKARVVFPNAKIIPIKKLLKDRIAQNDKILKSFK